jgi:alpha-beta hydrolase superfamily lysophospholipase
MSSHALRPLGSALAHLFPEIIGQWVAALATRPRLQRPPQLPEGAVPFTSRFGMAGLRWGESGPRVLALHGWQGQAAQFAELARALVARGLQVLALEAPGHGRSPGDHASPATFSDAVLESRPEIGALHAVIGHSMGGGAMLHALSTGLEAERAVVIASPAHYADVLARTSQRLALPERARQAFFRHMEQLTGVPVQGLDIGALAAQFSGELLVVHDRGDRAVPYADGERIAARAGAPLLSTEGLGHARLLSDPVVTTAVAEFIVEGHRSSPGPLH